MKLYREMMRKLTIVGLPLLAVTFVYTLVTGGQNCFGAVYTTQAVSAFAIAPILNYYVFTAAAFAFYGFSFLFSRPGSDVYHSLPVKRSDLYVSVLLATATWMGATVVLNVLETLAILLISGCPFVPAYIPLAILFYFVASMLVFAAAALGCALSGTVITAAASTGVVLLLPRFVQFLFARGVVERVPIVGWLDLNWLLNPTTNAATGILATFLRPVYASRLITLPHILYSLLPMLAMLGAGWWMFLRRPSEIAQKNGGHRLWTAATAVLLSFAVMLPVTMNQQRLFSVYGSVLMAAALAVFFVYQVIVSPKLKQVLMTLPSFLIAVLAVLGVSLLLRTAADSMLNTTPAAAQIASVTFRGFDEKSGEPQYTTLLTEDVAFTDAETKQYVADALLQAVDKIKNASKTDYYNYTPYRVVEPVTIKLAGGGTVRRTIEFDNVDELNALRMQNEAFAAGVRAFPPLKSIQYLFVDSGFTKAENWALIESYIAEATEKKLLNGYYYRDRSADMLADGTYVMQGENQSVTGFTAIGYVGGDRYSDGYTLRLDMPKTTELLMKTYNAYAAANPLEPLSAAIKRFDSEQNGANDSVSISLTAFNYPSKLGLPVQQGANFYISQYAKESVYPYDVKQMEYMYKFVDLLSRAVKTDQPEGMFIRLDWYYYEAADVTMVNNSQRPTSFLKFDTESDAQAFLALMEEWDTAQRVN